MAYAEPHSASLALPRWKTLAAVVAGALLGILFIVSGVWKITDPFGAATKMMQMKVPGLVAMPFTILLGIVEALAGVMLFIPRFRRWGGWLSGVMLIAFMLYVGYFYNDLRGEDCSCFPWLKRAVGPMFFISDAAMLLAAAVAWLWSRPSDGLRPAALMLAALSIFAVVSYGLNLQRNSGIAAPPSLTIAGQPVNIQQGKIFLYFYDPLCSHCKAAAEKMSKHNWKGHTLIGVSTQMPQYAQGFLDATGFKAQLTSDVEPLRKIFPFTDPPYGVALENGRSVALFSRFDDQEPENELRKLGFIE
ncbi:MAG: DoxX family protein [Bryobacteraceae bacterium]|nr:DoxX family protein [Bryobacteraceae bacterium]